METGTIIRIIDRTPFWEHLLGDKNKWNRAKWARRARKMTKDKTLNLSGTAFLAPEEKGAAIEEAIFWLECGFDLAYGKVMTPTEAKKLGKDFSWAVSTEIELALAKCDKEGVLIKRTSKINLDDFRKFLEEEVWKRKSLLRDGVLAFSEIGSTLLGWLRWGIKLLRSSL